MRWIGAVLLAWASLGTAQADWFEASTPRVRVVAEGSERNARALAEKLEKFDAALRVLRSIPAADFGKAGRLNVYVVRNATAVAKLANARNVAGFYVPRAGGSVAFVPQAPVSDGELGFGPQAVLLHEYTHHFMFRNFPGAYPAWFTEGFAEFHATASFDRDGGVMFGKPPLYRAYGLIVGAQLPIERLLEPDRKMSMEQIDNLYGRGWMLTHMLTFSQTRKGQLSTYMRALRSGNGSVDAATKGFGELRLLDRELDKYTRQRLMSATITADKLDTAPVEIRRLSDAEAAMMPIHIESTSGVTPQEAAKLLPRARRAAAPFPGDAFVQGALAEAEYDAGNFAEARAAALRALAADPKSRQGLVYHGMAMAAIADAAGDRAPATHKAIIAPWIQANRLDRDDPLPMALIHGSARSFGIDNKSIVAGVKYAQQMAPEDRGLRLTAAAEYLREGDLKTARPLIASLAYDPHSGNREAMGALLALIDSNDGGGAKAAMAAMGQQPETIEGKGGSEVVR